MVALGAGTETELAVVGAEPGGGVPHLALLRLPAPALMSVSTLAKIKLIPKQFASHETFLLLNVVLIVLQVVPAVAGEVSGEDEERGEAGGQDQGQAAHAGVRQGSQASHIYNRQQFSNLDSRGKVFDILLKFMN